VRKRGNPLVAILAVIVIAMAVRSCERRAEEPPREDRTDARINDELKPAAPVETRDGLAAAIVIDVSGSMADQVDGPDGRRETKIEVARRAALDIVDQFVRYADDHKDQPVLLGIYEFSRRGGQPDCRPVIPMGRPDRAQAAGVISHLKPDGGTPIGQAMITAKKELDATGLTARHLLVVTDGENTDGVRPERVAAGIARRPEAERPSIYFVAFDIEASRFSGVRDNGGLVLSAANAAELNETLDMLLRGSILVEK
jgi:Mg-chelatase subunit ChlD